jgi:hypothetical protein
MKGNSNECRFLGRFAVLLLKRKVLVRATWRNILGDDILHSHRLEYLKSYIVLTVWALQRGRNVSPVRYELGFYIPEDGILYSYSR